MSNIWKRWCLCDELQIDVGLPLPAMISDLKNRIEPRKTLRIRGGTGYEGEVSESGFTIRRISRHPKDTKQAVVIQGRFSPESDQTRVVVTFRHGLHFIFFTVLLYFVAIGRFLVFHFGTGTPSAAPQAAVYGGAILAGMAGLWHLSLAMDVARVKREVNALLKPIP